MSEAIGQKHTDEEYRWSYARTNSKGEKKFKNTTNQTIEYVTDYLDSKNIEYNLKLGGSMLWIYNGSKSYAYYYTTGRWANYNPSGYPDKHYSSKGIVDFVNRFLGENKAMEVLPENPMGNNLNNPERYKFTDGEWWYYYPESRARERASTLRKRINRRMYIDGKYIPKSHPLHKPGNYKGFTDAAFSSLANYEKSLEGQVYIIYNPSFPSWVKVGMAVDSEDRLKKYQTGSPYRDYTVYAFYPVADRKKAEAEAHNLLSEKHERRGEWFVCSSVVAKNILDSHFAGEQLELL